MTIAVTLLLLAAGLAADTVEARRPEPRSPRVPPLKLLEHLYSMRPSVNSEASSSIGSTVKLDITDDQFEDILGSVLAELESQLLSSPQAQKMFREACKYGLPDFDNLKFRDNYIASYNNKLKHPNWVMEHLTSTRMKCTRATRNPLHIFVTDDSIHEYFCANEYDYRRTGYDRGHLSPACDNMISTENLNQAYCFLNVAPQVRQLNRGGCPWARLESYVRHIALRARHTYVVTGTLYLPSHVLHGEHAGTLDNVVSYRLIGQDRVGVPSHFYKVIVYESKLDVMFMEAYIMPNHPQIDSRAELSQFRVNIDAGLARIEEAAGSKFFASLSKSKVYKPDKLQYGYKDQTPMNFGAAPPPVNYMVSIPYYASYWYQ